MPLEIAPNGTVYLRSRSIPENVLQRPAISQHIDVEILVEGGDVRNVSAFTHRYQRRVSEVGGQVGVLGHYFDDARKIARCLVIYDQCQRYKVQKKRAVCRALFAGDK